MGGSIVLRPRWGSAGDAGSGPELRSRRMANFVGLEVTLPVFPRERKGEKAEFWKKPHESARRVDRIRKREAPRL